MVNTRAGGGKSVIGCYWIIKNCLKYPGSRWMIGRAKLKTLKETTLMSFFEVCQMQGIKADVHFTYNKSTSEIDFFNGSKIFLKDLFLYPSDPNFDELGSLEITGAFVDECNQIVKKAWDIVQSRIRYKLEAFNLTPKILGTCNPSKQWVYAEFFKPSTDGRLRKDRRFIQSLVTDNPFISQHYIENLKKLDKVSRERLLYGNWAYEDDPAKLYEVDEIHDMFTIKAKQSTDKYITADIARFGDDKTVITYWEGWKGKIHAYTKKSTKEVAEIIIKLAEEKQVGRSRIVIDEDGIGGGVLDQIPGAKGFINNSVAVQSYEASYDPSLKNNYGNLKTQCAFILRERLQKREVEIIVDSEYKDLVIEEFEQIKQKDIDKDGKVYLLGKDRIKESIGRSPDFFDSIMQRSFFDLHKEIELKFIEF